MAQEQQHHEHRDEELVVQRTGERLQRLVDEARAIIKRHDRDGDLATVRQRFFRQPGGDSLDSLTHALDHHHRVRAITSRHDPANHLRSSVVERTSPQRGPELYLRHIPHPHRRVRIVRGDHGDF